MAGRQIVAPSPCLYSVRVIDDLNLQTVEDEECGTHEGWEGEVMCGRGAVLRV
jgi:hypothetical protein